MQNDRNLKAKIGSKGVPKLEPMATILGVLLTKWAGGRKAGGVFETSEDSTRPTKSFKNRCYTPVRLAEVPDLGYRPAEIDFWGAVRSMPSIGRIFIALALAAAWLGSSRAVDPPKDLPKYDMAVKLDTGKRLATVHQTTTWTNRSDRPTKQLLMNFYPHYQIPDGDFFLLAKTLELLRQNPNDGIDRKGRHGEIREIAWANPRGEKQRLRYSFNEENASALTIDLAEDVQPGQSVTIELDCTIRLPQKQGRWGQWNGITFLTFALPTLAYHDGSGWHAMPFVPWHQPFWNEAAHYRVTIDLPEDQKLACSATVGSIAKRDGWITHTMKPFVGRDFAILASADYVEHKRAAKMPDGRTVELRCLAYQRHAHYAEEMLILAEEALAQYSKWFGPYPYDHFTIAESYFGWNGNECAGLVMIDERVFDMPKLARGYVEYLISHEICHQWWYNLVGTNGYAETVMDEGPATYFTHKYLDQKRGRNNDFVAWPAEAWFAPHIRRENYRFGSMYGAIRRNEMYPAAGALPEYGNLFNLFTGAYDRGAKFFGMIDDRLGEAGSLEFFRGVVAKYSFRVLSAKAFQREFEEYTGKKADEFFNRYLYQRGMTDWSVDKVTIDGRRGPAVGRKRGDPLAGDGQEYRVEIIAKQQGEYDEPTTIGFRFAGEPGFPIRIPIGPTTRTLKLPEYEAVIEPDGPSRSRITITLPRKPVDVVIDPDRILLDANPGDNAWDRTPNLTITPLYTFLNETDLTADYDRWNLTAGPWIWGASYQDPWYTRSTMLGVRAGAFRTQTFLGGLYAAYRTDTRDVVAGVDATLMRWPWAKTQVGVNYERRIAGPFFDNQGRDAAQRASIYGRYIIQEGISLYLPPISYAEVYSTYQDNFLPTPRERAPGAERYRSTWLSGIHFRTNLYTPYWDPERGVWVDFTYAGGVARLNETVTTHQVRGELATAQKLPDGLGYFSDTRLAGRVVVASSWPDRGEFFSLGGSTMYRGFDLRERQGSTLWLANAEARIPILRESRYNVLDSFLGVRNIWMAAFYDVGDIYANGQSVRGVAHAVGLGVRVDTAIFSFIERATLRLDVAKTVNADSGVQVWFGVQHPF